MRNKVVPMPGIIQRRVRNTWRFVFSGEKDHTRVPVSVWTNNFSFLLYGWPVVTNISLKCCISLTHCLLSTIYHLFHFHTLLLYLSFRFTVSLSLSPSHYVYIVISFSLFFSSGDGSQMVALSHVDDVTSMIAAAVGNEKAFKQVLYYLIDE